MAARTVARGRVVLEVDDRGAKRNLQQLDERANKSAARLEHGLGKAALIAGGGLAAAAVGAKKLVDAASNLNELISKTTVVFGKAARDVLEWSKTTASSIGVSRRAALDAVGVFGNMLRPMGFAPELAARMSKRFVQLAADMASFNDASPEETLEALRSGLAGETEPLRRFGVFLNAERVQLEAVSKGLVKARIDHDALAAARTKLELATRDVLRAEKEHGKTSDEAMRAQLRLEQAERAVEKALAGKIPKLTAAQKAAATYSVIMRDTALQQGDFERTSDSLANQQRILRAELEDVSAELGVALMPAAIAVAGTLRDLVGWVRENQNEAKLLAGTLTVLAAGVVAVDAAMKAAAASTKLFNAAMKAGLFLRSHPLLLLGAGLLAGISALDRIRGGFLDTVGPTERARQAVDAYKAALDRLKGAAETEAEAKRRLNEARVREESAHLAVLRSIDQRREAQRDLAEAERQHGKDSEEYRQAHLRAREAHLGVVAAFAARTRARKDLNDAEKAATKAEQDHSTAVHEAARAQGRLGERLAAVTNFHRNEYLGGLRQAQQGHRDLNDEAVQYGNARMRNALEAYLEKMRALAKHARENGAPAFGIWADEAARLARAIGKVPSKKQVDVRVALRLGAGMGVARAQGTTVGDGALAATAVSAIDRGIVRMAEQQVVQLPPSLLPVGSAANPGGLKPWILDELAIAQAYGLRLTSGLRPGSVTSTGRQSLHSVGQAIDVAGSGAAMAMYAQAVAGRPGVAEVLYTPVGGWYPGAGWTRLSGKLAADHYDHVHVGVRGDGIVGVGDGLVDARRRRPSSAFGTAATRRTSNIDPATGVARPRRPPSGGRSVNIELPVEIRLAIARARHTDTLDDDIAALRRAERHYERLLDYQPLTGEQRITVLDQLLGVRSEIRQLEEQRDGGGEGPTDPGRGGVDDFGGPTPEEIEEMVQERVRATVEAFTGAASSLRGYASNVIPRHLLGGVSIPGVAGAPITLHAPITNVFPVAPDALTWSKSIEFEIRGLFA